MTAKILVLKYWYISPHCNRWGNKSTKQPTLRSFSKIQFGYTPPLLVEARGDESQNPSFELSANLSPLPQVGRKSTKATYIGEFYTRICLKIEFGFTHTLLAESKGAKILALEYWQISPPCHRWEERVRKQPTLESFIPEFF